MIHELKTWPIYFNAVASGHKTFEYRVNDRNYNAGDILVLREFDPINGYAGRLQVVKVVYIVFGSSGNGLGIPEGYCIMSIIKISTTVDGLMK